tara:strand:+ start:1321 stop:1500 length:180 start_codon:yes stop_codon:yes gene_type:complete
MLKKTPSQDSSFEEIWWEMEAIEPLTPPQQKVKAKKIDDYHFHENDIYKNEMKSLCGRD